MPFNRQVGAYGARMARMPRLAPRRRCPRRRRGRGGGGGARAGGREAGCDVCVRWACHAGTRASKATTRAARSRLEACRASKASIEAWTARGVCAPRAGGKGGCVSRAGGDAISSHDRTSYVLTT